MFYLAGECQICAEKGALRPNKEDVPNVEDSPVTDTYLKKNGSILKVATIRIASI